MKVAAPVLTLVATLAEVEAKTVGKILREVVTIRGDG